MTTEPEPCDECEPQPSDEDVAWLGARLIRAGGVCRAGEASDEYSRRMARYVLRLVDAEREACARAMSPILQGLMPRGEAAGIIRARIGTLPEGVE